MRTAVIHHAAGTAEIDGTERLGYYQSGADRRRRVVRISECGRHAVATRIGRRRGAAIVGDAHATAACTDRARCGNHRMRRTIESLLQISGGNRDRARCRCDGEVYCAVAALVGTGTHRRYVIVADVDRSPRQRDAAAVPGIGVSTGHARIAAHARHWRLRTAAVDEAGAVEGHDTALCGDDQRLARRGRRTLQIVRIGDRDGDRICADIAWRHA